jgi:threonine dehydrogenase-like Zn-dependent dehydrogenase
VEGLVYHGPWTAETTSVPEPSEPRGAEVLVRVRASGICGTDLNILAGEYAAVMPPVIVGHESAGEVVAVGELVSDLEVGDRVAVNPTYYCDACRMCRTNRPNHCERKNGSEAGVSADGTHATFYVTERRLVEPMPAGVPFSAVALAEPLSCALTGVDQLALRPELSVAVFGAGPMGLLYAHCLALRGLVGQLVDASAPRRELARAALPDRWSLAGSVDEAVELAGPTGLDVIVDTTSVLVARAVGILNRGGQLLLVGLRPQHTTIDPAALADRSVRLVGSIDSIGTFGTACALLARGALPASHIVSHAVPLSRWREAFSLLGCDLDSQTRDGAPTALKVVLEP